MLLCISPVYVLLPIVARYSHRTVQDRPATQPKADTIMPVLIDPAGRAALSICESLLLALNDAKLLPEREILGILRDAAAAHEGAPDRKEAEMHEAVAVLINGILAGGNSVRRR